MDQVGQNINSGLVEYTGPYIFFYVESIQLWTLSSGIFVTMSDILKLIQVGWVPTALSFI